MGKRAEKIEFGDFQTPPALAQSVCELLASTGLQPASVLEPTCGVGEFLWAALDRFPNVQRALGAEIKETYVERVSRAAACRPDRRKSAIVQADFFVTDWQHVMADLPEPILIIGNPPWVTNSQLGVLHSSNLPRKSNIHAHQGLDALTGKSNFDISEWMLIRLLEAMNGRNGALAMLCKSSTARKVLSYGWKHRLSISESATYRIDAAVHFGAAVEAVLLVVTFRPGRTEQTAVVYDRLQHATPERTIGYEDQTLVADVKAYRRWKRLCGESRLTWRSGVKHDCAKVMELHREGDRFRNGFGDLVELEDDFLFPMVKSSCLANGHVNRESRVMIVTQKFVGQETRRIRCVAPATWEYLRSHADALNRRASSIYRKRPPFSVFGVGDYTFARWKVAIGGLYKKLAFHVLGPVDNQPVVLDDTCYFLPCQTAEQANYLASLLNSPTARAFYEAFVFWDSKRPITAELLRRLSLRNLARELRSEDLFDSLISENLPDNLRAAQLELFWRS